MGKHRTQSAAEAARDLGMSYSLLTVRLREMGVRPKRGRYVITQELKRRLERQPVRKYRKGEAQ